MSNSSSNHYSPFPPHDPTNQGGLSQAATIVLVVAAVVIVLIVVYAWLKGRKVGAWEKGAV